MKMCDAIVSLLQNCSSPGKFFLTGAELHPSEKLYIYCTEKVAHGLSTRATVLKLIVLLFSDSPDESCHTIVVHRFHYHSHENTGQVEE